MKQTFEEWWAELLAIAAKHGHTPGMPGAWQRDNYNRGHTPEQAYKREYEDFE